VNFGTPPLSPTAPDPARPRRLGLRAFTILEVMFAAIVMAFAITTSITTMQRGFAMLDTARNISQAHQIIQTEIEKIRMKDWTVVAGYTAAETTIPIDTIYTSNAGISSRYTLTRTITDVSGYSLSGMKLITFTISWRNYDGRPLSRSMSIYYGQNGLYDYYYNQI
jgi:type II secretory pathway pseudopilin PulG